MKFSDNQIVRICTILLCSCAVIVSPSVASAEEGDVRVYKPIDQPRFLKNDFTIRSLQAEEKDVDQFEAQAEHPLAVPDVKEAERQISEPIPKANIPNSKPDILSNNVLNDSRVSSNPNLNEDQFVPYQKKREAVRAPQELVAHTVVDAQLSRADSPAPDQGLFLSASLLDPELSPSEYINVDDALTAKVAVSSEKEFAQVIQEQVSDDVVDARSETVPVVSGQAKKANDEDLKADAARDQGAPVDFAADKLLHQSDNQTIVASGNVEIEQDGRILRADEMIYNLEKDEVIAKGNVVLTEANGDVYFADSFTLRRSMKEGFVRELEGYLSSGGKFSAQEGERLSDKRIVMKNASYTLCDCEDDKDGTPAWNIRAAEVTYDTEEHHIYYKNAKFEVFGVPVFYTPRLSHPDNTVKRKSGFLTPSFGYDSDIGANWTQEYYWSIADDKDATFGLLASTDEAPVGLIEYRQRFGSADFQINGSITHSDRTDDINGTEFRTDQELRGHLFAEGGWDINDKWRSGLEIEYTSDDQYLNQYNISSADVLESKLFIERFDNRNYATASLIAFQDLRLLEESVDQPNILPQVYSSFYGDPNALLGGRWNMNGSVLGLMREDGQDMNRFIGEVGWQRRFVSDYGIVSTFDTNLRGDAYHVTDRDIATFGSGRSNDSTQTRFIPSASMTTTLPLAKQYSKASLLIEPIVAMHLAPDVEEEDNDIPNEDSQDVQLDIINLFADSRFPGYDLIEDRSRVTYGLRTGLYGYDGSYLRGFLGQSYRFDEADNPFPQGSGLDRQESDIVGQISADYRGKYGLDYRFQLVGDTFNSARHEADLYADLAPFHFDIRYLFAQELEGTNIDETREQGRFATGVDLTDNWHVFSDIIYDLGEENGLREAWFGLDYSGCCVSYSISARRNITDDASGESGTEVMFRMGLKGLGEFGFDDDDRWNAGNR